MKLLIGILIAVFLVNLSPLNVEAIKVLKESKTYTVPDEFSFKYPYNWKLQERENRFSTVDAILTYGPVNNVIMTFQTGNKSEFGLSGSDNESMNTMERFLTDNFEAANLYEKGSNKYIINNHTAPYVIGTYTGGWSTDLRTGETSGVDWAVMLAAVHLNDDKVVFVQYKTPIDDFDRYLPKVQQILKSISPINSTETNLQN